MRKRLFITLVLIAVHCSSLVTITATNKVCQKDGICSNCFEKFREKITLVRRPINKKEEKTCNNCYGKGYVNGYKCQECSGRGYIIVEVSYIRIFCPRCNRTYYYGKY